VLEEGLVSVQGSLERTIIKAELAALVLADISPVVEQQRHQPAPMVASPVPSAGFGSICASPRGEDEVAAAIGGERSDDGEEYEGGAVHRKSNLLFRTEGEVLQDAIASGEADCTAVPVHTLRAYPAAADDANDTWHGGDFENEGAREEGEEEVVAPTVARDRRLSYSRIGESLASHIKGTVDLSSSAEKMPPPPARRKAGAPKRVNTPRPARKRKAAGGIVRFLGACDEGLGSTFVETGDALTPSRRTSRRLLDKRRRGTPRPAAAPSSPGE